jgi:hypothetical protein
LKYGPIDEEWGSKIVGPDVDEIEKNDFLIQLSRDNVLSKANTTQTEQESGRFKRSAGGRSVNP